MKPVIGVATFAVKDLAASRRFYVDGMGWTPVFDDNDVIFFQMNGFVFALFARDSYLKDSHLTEAGTGASNLALMANDNAEADQIFAAAVKAGAKALKKPEKTFWGGYSGYFADFDGHVWEVAHNPFWPIDSKGHVTYQAA